MNNKCYIAIDCGGTKIAAALFSEQGQILKEETLKLEGAGGKDAADKIVTLINSLLHHAQTSNSVPVSLGVCIPGIVYHDTGKVWAPNIPDWDEYPLLDHLLKSLPKSIKVSIDSDRACYILGETWMGSAKGAKNAIFVAVGTGIGAGILVDGKILRGHGDIAGATGWMALQRPYNKKFDACGNFEYYASGDGVARTAKEILKNTTGYEGTLNPGTLRSEDVFEAFDKGDPVAIETFGQCIELWGMAVANYVSLFNPEKIILGGGVFGPAVKFIPQIMEEAKKWAQPISITQVSLKATTLGKHAGLIGAGRLAMLNT
ncbi:MAG: ROK family protein [Candidatus Marinimicrobia bacterium]|nr:ROK family protein [Candidatus Neomarinimicrobiota bacterium]